MDSTCWRVTKAPAQGSADVSPTASIVIPAHNAASFVHEAIASAQEQSLKDIEIIVVDDGSTDATSDIVSSFVTRDPRVIPIRRAMQGGPSAACNTGFDRARGRWIVLLDADDLFLPQRVERLVALGEATGADLIADDLLQRDFVSGADLGRHFGEAMMRHDGPLTLAEMVQRDMPHLPAKLGFVQPIKRREFLVRTGVRFAEDIGAGEDFLFYFECVARGARFHLTPEAYYIYRIRHGSVSNARPMAHHLSNANRRKVEIASGLRDPALSRLLRIRQRALDFGSLSQAAQDGRYWDALAFAHSGTPAHLLRQFRVVVGAARQNSATREAGGLARAT
jgi:succinoglycan biosynthesis protein ExoO